MVLVWSQSWMCKSVLGWNQNLDKLILENLWNRAIESGQVPAAKSTNVLNQSLILLQWVSFRSQKWGWQYDEKTWQPWWRRDGCVESECLNANVEEGGGREGVQISKHEKTSHNVQKDYSGERVEEKSRSSHLKLQTRASFCYQASHFNVLHAVELNLTWNENSNEN